MVSRQNQIDNATTAACTYACQGFIFEVTLDLSLQKNRRSSSHIYPRKEISNIRNKNDWELEHTGTEAVVGKQLIREVLTPTPQTLM